MREFIEPKIEHLEKKVTKKDKKGNEYIERVIIPGFRVSGSGFFEVDYLYLKDAKKELLSRQNIFKRHGKFIKIKIKNEI